MIVHTYFPQPPLSDFVDLFWSYEGYQPAHPKEQLLPTGTVTLVIEFSSQEFPICGPHSEPFIIDTSQPLSFIGVHFKPGGAFPFFKLPTNELHNQVVSLDTLWGPTANDLRDRLLEAKTPAARFRIFEQALLDHATHSLIRHPAVTFTLKTFQKVPHTRPISEVVEQIGLSQRRFIQVFSEQVGLTPKLFCRVRRFQEALCLIEKGQRLDWADIALTCGYFDQAHFIHDFQALSGFTPTTYLTQRGPQLNHVPLHDGLP